QVIALAVAERPQLVAGIGENRGGDGGDGDRGERAQPRPGAQRVGAADRDEEREDAHHAELGGLVYKNPEPGVQIANESHPPHPSFIHPVYPALIAPAGDAAGGEITLRRMSYAA